MKFNVCRLSDACNICNQSLTYSVFLKRYNFMIVTNFIMKKLITALPYYY